MIDGASEMFWQDAAQHLTSQATRTQANSVVDFLVLEELGSKVMQSLFLSFIRGHSRACAGAADLSVWLSLCTTKWCVDLKEEKMGEMIYLLHFFFP